jgi:hypothetical protein
MNSNKKIYTGILLAVVAIFFFSVDIKQADAGCFLFFCSSPSVKYPPTSPTNMHPGLQFGENQCTNGWGNPQFAPDITGGWSGFASNTKNEDPDCVRVYMDSTPIPMNTDIRLCAQSQDGAFLIYGSGSGPVRCTPWVSEVASGATVAGPWVSESDQYNPDAWRIKIESRVMPNDTITSRSVSDMSLGIQVADHLYFNKGCREQIGRTIYTPTKASGGGWSNPMAHDGEEHEDMNCIKFYIKPVMVSNLMPAITLSAPASVLTGNTATLTYTVTHADTCTLSGSNGDSWTGFAADGSKTTKTLSDPNTTYVLSCTGIGGTNTVTKVIATSGLSCTLGTVTVPHGTTRTFYSQTIVPVGQLCSAFSQSRTCTDGVLSGSAAYNQASCSVSTACTLDGATIPNGGQDNFYSQKTPGVGKSCADYKGVRGCAVGVLTGNASYQYASCTDKATVRITANGVATSTTVRKDASAVIAWNGDIAQSCTITGTDGFSASGVSGSQNHVITQKTVFTATCLLGTTPSEASVIVNLIPTIIEQGQTE